MTESVSLIWYHIANIQSVQRNQSYHIGRSIGRGFCNNKSSLATLMYFQLMKPKNVKTMRKMMHECNEQGIEDRCLQKLFGASYFWS